MKLAFFGTPEFAVPSLDALLASRHEVALVVAQPDRRAGRGMSLRRPPVAERAAERGIALLQPERIRDEGFAASFAAAGVDAAAVVAYGRILPGSLLALPRHGFLNVHGSILPKYRGAAPIQRAIENGESKTGVTIMQLDVEMDHGPVFAIQEVAIGPDEKTPTLASRLAAAGGALLVEILDAIERGAALAREQDHAAATYAPKIEREEGLVRWDEPARKLYDRYRAFDPWPGLTAAVRGEAIRLVELEAGEAGSAAPGEIVAIEGESVTIACGEGSLRLLRMQRPGKKPVAAADLLRGWGIGVGERLA